MRVRFSQLSANVSTSVQLARNCCLGQRKLAHYTLLQDAAGEEVKVLQAISKDEMKWANDKPVAARIALRKGSQASEMDRNIVKTIFEAAGFAVVKEGSLDQV